MNIFKIMFFFVFCKKKLNKLYWIKIIFEDIFNGKSSSEKEDRHFSENKECIHLGKY